MSLTAGKQLLLSSAAGAAATGVSRSLRFNSSDSAYLSRTPASAGNRKTWTWAGWVKRSGLDSGTQSSLFGNNGSSDNTFGLIAFFSNNIIIGGYTINYLVTSAVYRDLSAWMHIVVAMNTTQATASNRLKVYINGSEATAFSTDNRSSISQNSDQGINQAVSHAIGRQDTGSGSSYFSGYLADIYFIDGQALDPSSFTETDATTGQLIPKAYTGSYGANGFHLEFADNASNTATTLGKDTSGNGNNWTPNNLSVITGGPTSVASASGALPIYNTTDTYGATKGTGVRSDSFASSLVLAAPLTTQGGGALTDDVSPTGRTSSVKTLTNTNATSSTSVSKYYGGSAVFSSSSSSIISAAGATDFQFGSGDFTVEFWIYPTNTTGQNVLGYGNSAGGTGYALIKTSSQFQGQFAMSDGTKVFTGGSYTVNTWNHVAAVRSGSTITLYVNGISSATTSTSGSVTTGTDGFSIGRYGLFGGSCDAQFQDVRIYKGVAKYTSNFNPPSSTQNTTIAAGNDSLVDVPVNGAQTDTGVGGEVRGNYCTLNPLFKTGAGTPAYSNGNLDLSAGGGSGGDSYFAGTFLFSTGKYYYETTINAIGNGVLIGVCAELNSTNLANIGSYRESGIIYNLSSATQTAGSAYTTGDIIGVAIDCDNATVKFYKNGVGQGATPSFTFTAGTNLIVRGRSNGEGASLSFNFGQRPFAYTAPSGFKALNTANLPAPLVTKSNTVMDVVAYTGTGNNRSITSLAFSPDFVWFKKRNAAFSHTLRDAVRGVTKSLNTNNAYAEATWGGVDSFDSNGFSLSNDTATNALNDTYVAWCWDAGSSTVTNTQGSITSQVRANATAGFSVVTAGAGGYFGGSVGHGLSVTPEFIIMKDRNGTLGWRVYHKSTGNNFYFDLTTGAAINYGSNLWNITSSVFGSSQVSGYTLAAYCWAPVVGYSSFGSYTGNGSTDGPFVYTGFRPAFVMMKMSSSTSHWWMNDNKRTGAYNVADGLLFPNLSSAESTFATMDFLSNGFKLRAASSDINTSSATYIYAAFAESPFNYARAR